jgi:hypothetical protein
MPDIFLTHRIGRQRHICISELSTDTLVEHGLKGAAYRSGMYLYTLDDRPRVGGISILGRVPTTDAAFELLDLFKMVSARKTPKPKQKTKTRKPAAKVGKRSKGRRGSSNSEARM